MIDARSRKALAHVASVWDYRDVLAYLAWRDLKVRYKQTVLGVAWAIFQPLFIMTAFAVFFGHFAGIPSDGIPYPLFVFSALVPWTLFASSVTQSGPSLLNNQALVTKVYVPRLIIPLSVLLVALVDFAVGFGVLVILLALYGIVPGIGIVALPLWLLMALVTALAVGIWLAALTVEYRDVRHLLPLLTQVWLLATPIAYPSSLLPEPWRTVSGLNPMAGVVEGFRWALFGKSSANGSVIAVSLVVIAALLVSGIVYFSRHERRFADLL